jgi:hypothetical protein
MFEYLNPADRPVIEGLEDKEVVFAKDQPEYIPLRALVSTGDDKSVLTRWALTQEQRKSISDGSDIYLELLTFGEPLQPIRIIVSDLEGGSFLLAFSE